MSRNVLLISMILMIANLLASASDAQERDFPNISVSGSAEIRVKPDQAVLTAAVNTRAKTVQEASTENEQKISKVIEFLKGAGVSAENVRTDYINIKPIFPGPDYPQFGKSVQAQSQSFAPNAPNRVPVDDQKLEKSIQPIGYDVRRQFTIRITDLKNFETVYKGLIENGVNNVDKLQFETSELRTHRDDARLKAVKAAREKAEAMAKELGASLSAVHSIQEASDRWNVPVHSNSVFSPAAENEDTFAVGLISINAQVNVVFELGNNKFEKENSDPSGK